MPAGRRLNPFVFRAVFLRRRSQRLSIPRKSQSLCFQGCVFTLVSLNKGYVMKSQSLCFQGCVFTSQKTSMRIVRILSQSLCFQGCVFTNRRGREGNGNVCLNPFVFRAVFLHEEGARQEGRRGLNPFVFRAVFLLPRRRVEGKRNGLNPFVFRAVFLRQWIPFSEQGNVSQSLCFQGCVFTNIPCRLVRGARVSIPLFSGLCFYGPCTSS